MKFVRSMLADVPVSRLSATPVFSSFTSRPGFVSAVAFLIPDKEPLGLDPYGFVSEVAFAKLFPIHRSTEGRNVP
jgi:hypothetical protein